MGFIENIKEEIGKPFNIQSFRAVLFGDESVYFENVQSIKSYSTLEIVLSLKKGDIKIKGERLFIKKYCLGDLIICGKINCILIN